MDRPQTEFGLKRSPAYIRRNPALESHADFENFSRGVRMWSPMVSRDGRRTLPKSAPVQGRERHEIPPRVAVRDERREDLGQRLANRLPVLDLFDALRVHAQDRCQPALRKTETAAMPRDPLTEARALGLRVVSQEFNDLGQGAAPQGRTRPLPTR